MTRTYFFCLTTVLLTRGLVWADLAVKEYVAGSGEFVTFDDQTGYHWYWNLPDFVDMTYGEQTAEIAGLGTYGYIAHGWHMASPEEMGTLWSYDADTIMSMFRRSGDIISDSQPYTYWAGRYDGEGFGDEEHLACFVSTHDGTTQKVPLGHYSVHDETRREHLSTWVVSNQSVVPLPTSLILAATGLLSSTLGLNRLRRKHEE
jgi:hypothetical protein